jgi:hypothetical protein
MELALQILVVLVGLALLLTGTKRFELSRYARLALSILDLLVLIAATVALKWVGLGLALGANVIAILCWSVYLAMRKESHLTYAAIQLDVGKGDMESLYDRLYDEYDVFHVLGPIQTSELISLLSQRARSIPEIEHIAPVIAMLVVINSVELEWMVERFDQILRLYGEPASKAVDMANTLTIATKKAAASFHEMVEGMIVFADPGS